MERRGVQRHGQGRIGTGRRTEVTTQAELQAAKRRVEDATDVASDEVEGIEKVAIEHGDLIDHEDTGLGPALYGSGIGLDLCEKRLPASLAEPDARPRVDRDPLHVGGRDAGGCAHCHAARVAALELLDDKAEEKRLSDASGAREEAILRKTEVGRSGLLFVEGAALDDGCSRWRRQRDAGRLCLGPRRGRGSATIPGKLALTLHGRRRLAARWRALKPGADTDDFVTKFGDLGFAKALHAAQFRGRFGARGHDTV